ncbi:MAG: branched-chain amino acid ABC transporter substrate-binding protein [Gemmataceae bacterium]|nr:branched-chain amino acid ABC transporter substrate-binding protein [Gemmataceae bacterium]
MNNRPESAAESRAVSRRRFLGVAAAGAAGAGLAGFYGCRNGGNGGETIKIVSSLPRTGSAQGQTDTIVNGIKLAIDDAGGKVGDFTIEYTDMDDATAAAGKWDGPAEAANARKAVADDDVMVFIGPYNSGAAKVSMPILNEGGVLQISPAATWPGLTKKQPGDTSGEPDIYRPSGKVTFCRVCPTDDVQGPLSADFAKETLGAKRVYILDDKELYGAGIAGLFQKRCEETGVQILGREGIVPTQQTFSEIASKVAALKPDMVYFGGTTQTAAGRLIKDLRAAGLTCPVMVPDGCYEQAFLESASARDLANVYATFGGTDPSLLKGAGAEFVKKYKAKHGKEPEAYAIYGYEAGKVFLEAVKKVGKKDREAILKECLATKDFSSGAAGTWSFDKDGDTTLQQLTITKVENGKFVPQKTVDKKK